MTTTVGHRISCEGRVNQRWTAASNWSGDKGRRHMTLAIGAVIAHAATTISAAAPAMLPGRVWRQREESPLEPAAASEAVARLIQTILATLSETNWSDVTV